MTASWGKWLKGLAAAIVNGFASGILLIVVDPTAFDIVTQWKKLLIASGLLGLLGMANYLKQAPVPPDDTSGPVNPARFATLLVLAVLVCGLGWMPACAATTPLAKAQVGAVATGKAALAVDQAEYDAYGAGLYDLKTHQALGVPIRAVLHAARAYARAVSSWAGTDPYAAPADVAKARAAIGAAVDDLDAALGPVKGADPIRAAVRALRATLGLPMPVGPSPSPTQAGLPLVALLALLAKVYNERAKDGTVGAFLVDMLAALRKNGATAEDLAAVDGELSAAILRREAEGAGS